MLSFKIIVCDENAWDVERWCLGHQHRRILGLRDQLPEEIVAASKLSRNSTIETGESPALTDYSFGYRRKALLFINLGSNRSERNAIVPPGTRWSTGCWHSWLERQLRDTVGRGDIPYRQQGARIHEEAAAGGHMEWPLQLRCCFYRAGLRPSEAWRAQHRTAGNRQEGFVHILIF